MNVVAWVIDALKTHPEPVSMPEAITEDSTLLELAEARSRLSAIAQVATDLRRLVDRELAGKIPTAFRYGEDVYRPANGAGKAKVADETTWWPMVLQGLMDSPRPLELLSNLYPASSVRLTALPKLAAALGIEHDELRSHHIVYDPPTSPLSVMPRSKAPKFLQDLEEGEVR